MFPFVVAAALAMPDVAWSDLDRFPGPAVAEENYGFAVKHGMWLGQQAVECKCNTPWEQGAWQPWLWEASDQCEAWRLLYAAHNARGNDRQLYNLRQLRDKIGPCSYATGHMPDVVPWHRFRKGNGRD